MTEIWGAAVAVLRWFIKRPWAIAAVVLAGYCWHLQGTVRDLRADLRKAEGDVRLAQVDATEKGRDLLIETENARIARVSNDALASALTEVREQARKNLEIAREADARAARASEALRIAADTIRHQAAQEAAYRDRLYESDPDCAVLRTVPVCPGIADRLRESARAHDPPAPYGDQRRDGARGGAPVR